MTMDAGGNNLRLGNSGNSIKLTGFKGGIKREQLSNSKMQTIFDKVDKNGDGVLTDTEIAQFKKDMQDTAKNDKLSNREAKNYLKNGEKPVDTKEVSGKDMMSFLKEVDTISEKSKVDRAEEVTTEDGKHHVVLTSDNENTIETIHTDDNTSTIQKKDEENHTITTEEYDANHNITDKTVVDSSDAENIKTTTTEYNPAEKGETPTEKTITETSNGYKAVTECDEKGNPTVKTETNENDKTKTTTEFQPAVDGQEVKPKKVTVEGEGLTSETNYNENGEPTTKHEVKGTVTSDYTYVDSNERLDHRVENKGGGVTSELTYEYTDDKNYTETKVEAGKTTVTTFVDGKKSTIKDDNSETKITYTENGSTEVRTENNGNVSTTQLNNEGHRLTKTKTVDGKEYTLNYDGNGNTTGIIVQNGESPEAIAKKFGCSVAELRECNKDILNGKKYFDVGAEIKIPREIEPDTKVLRGRKSAEGAKAEFARDEQIRQQRRAEARAREEHLRNDLGLINHNGEGTKITGDYYNKGQKTRSVELTKVGDATHGRKIAQDKNGKLYVVAHNGVILKDSWAEVSAHREVIVTSNGGRVAVEGSRGDGHNRSIVYDGDGNTHVMSHDNKILKNDYVARSDYADTVRTNKGTAKTATLDILDQQLANAEAAFNEQMAQDGWAGDVADGVSKIWNNDYFLGGALNTGNTASQVRDEMRNYREGIKTLRNSKSQAEFNSNFQKLYDVPYNENAVADYVQNPTEANYKKAFGTKNDIGTRVAKYNESQQTCAAVVKTTAKVGAGIAIGAATVATGGAAGLAIAAAGTAAASGLIEESDRTQVTGQYKDANGNVVKTEGTFRKGTDHGQIWTDAAWDGASVLVGGGIGKVASTVVKGSTVLTAGGKTVEVLTKGQKIGRAGINVAGDAAFGAGQEYVQTGDVTLKGTAINGATGLIGQGVVSGTTKKVGQKAKSSISNTFESVGNKVKGKMQNITHNKPSVNANTGTSVSTSKVNVKPEVNTNPKPSVDANSSGTSTQRITSQTGNTEPTTQIRKPAQPEVSKPKAKADEELTEIRKPDVSGDTEPITSIQEPKTNTTTTTEANDIDDTLYQRSPGTYFDEEKFGNIMTEVKNIDTIEGLNDYISMLNNKKLTQEQRQQLQKQIRETKNNIVAGNTQTGNGTVALDKSGKMNKTIDATFKRKKEMDRGASFTVADNARIKVSDSCNVDLKNPELKAKLANLKPGERITVGRSKGDGLSTQDPYRFDIPDAPTTVSREHLILEKIDGQIYVTHIGLNNSKINNSLRRMAVAAKGDAAREEIKNETRELAKDHNNNRPKMA